MTFQQALIASLCMHGDKTAIEYGDRHISYSSLLKQADSITGYLLNEGLQHETVVGILVDDRADLICSVIGVVNARCVFVLIDGSLPELRLTAIMHDLNLQYIISSRHRQPHQAIEKINGIHTFHLEDIWANADTNRQNAIHYPAFDDEDSLYIYFTSGSTGNPKGIVGKNCSLLQFLHWEIEAFEIDSGNRTSQFISPFFDAFLRDIFVPLLTGGTICIPPAHEEDFYSTEKIVSWINRSEVTLIHCVPTFFRHINKGMLTAAHFTALKHVLLSGEKIIPAELIRWYEVFDSRIQLVNLYGPTETTMIRCYYKIMPADVKLARIPVGYPINDTEILIAQPDMRPCQLLVTGDLYIITRFTTKGYLNAPALTNEKFRVLNAGTPDERVAFKTGDKARWLPDGKIDLLGREDRQVKLGGIRIELDEIEYAIMRSKMVSNVVAMKHVDETGNELLLAFMIPDHSQQQELLLTEALRTFLALHLPAYMIPANMIAVNEFPLLPNGKTNYKALLNYLPATAIVAPVNDIEEKLLEIWKEILGDKSISTLDSFHTIGGNSLGIMRLIGKIYAAFNVRISLSDLFTHLTIKKQAGFIQAAQKDNLFVIEKAKEKDLYHVSSSQERIYFKYALDKTSVAYNLPKVWQINGPLDIRRIERVLHQLIDRHESLRTGFTFQNGEVMQYIRPFVDFRLQKLTTAGRSLREVIADFVQPFDLGKAPLISCGVAEAEDGKRVLIVDIHHIICDGMSQWKLQTEFLELYNNGELPALHIQYKDYAEWEYQYRRSNEYLLQREYWLNKFEGAIPKLALPVTMQGADGLADAGGSITFSIDRNMLSAIRGNPGNPEITNASVLFSIYYLYLAHLSAQDDIVVGLTTSGRMQQELDGVLGMFVKTLPVRYRLDVNKSFYEFLQDICKCLIEARTYQIYDLVDIVSELNNNRTAHVGNLFDAVFVYLNYENNNDQAGPQEFSTITVEHSTAKYPLLLFATETTEAFQLRLEYSTACFTRSDIELQVVQFKSLIKLFSDDLHTRISDCFEEYLYPLQGVATDLAARGYWKQRLQGFGLNGYFFSKAAVASTEPSFAEYSIAGSAQLAANLKAIAPSNKEIHIVLLSALAVLIQKCSAFSDICIFTPAYGSEPATAHNAEPVSVRFSAFDDLCFAELLTATKAHIRQDLKYAGYPIQKIFEAIDEDVQRLPITGLILAEIQSTRSFEQLTPEILFCFKQDAGISLTIKYDSYRFEQEYIVRIAIIYFNLLNSLILERDKPIRQVPVISEKEKQQLLHAFNNTQTVYPAEKSFIDLFEEQVNANPEQVALVAEGVSLTYKELNEWAGELAVIIRQSCKGAAIVPLYMLPSVQMVVGILGIMKAGKAFLPLDPNQGTARHEFILKTNNIEAVVVHPLLATSLAFAGIKIIPDRSASNNSGNLPVSDEWKNEPAYVIYTSGSTGEPKGVRISQRNLVNYCVWFKNALGLTAHDRSLLTSSYAFDLGYTSLFPILISGGTLHLVSGSLYQSPEALLNYIHRCKISYLKLTPSLFKTVTGASNFQNDRLQSIRYIILGGEPPVVEDMQLTQRHYKHIRFINHYGPTETTIGAITQPITDLADFEANPSIGKPISNTQAIILNKHRQLLPPGIPGELCIGGDGVGMGYLNQEALTREKFISTAFFEGRPVYRTGDLARWLPDGRIQFLGRIDNQVKIRGFRVEPGEVEARLLEHPSVTGTIVVVKGNGIDRHLVAYYVSANIIEEKLLKDYLAARLPDYMMPSWFVHLKSFPLTLNGKLNRKALPEPAIITAADHQLPSNELEEKLAGIWSEVLKLEKGMISVTKSFFELGGNSLKIIQLVTAINKTLKLKLSLPEIFRYPTIAGLVQYITAGMINKKQNDEDANNEITGMEQVINILGKS